MTEVRYISPRQRVARAQPGVVTPPPSDAPAAHRFKSEGGFSAAVMRRRLALGSATLALLVGTIVALVPLASAAGSGYNLSYSRASGSTTNANIDLVSVSSTDNGGATLSVTFQVSGHLVLSDSNYAYSLFFGGGGQSNSTAWATFTNNSTVGDYFSSSGGGFSSGPLAYSLGSGGASLTFAINKTAVGPSSAYSLNAYAVYSLATGGGGISWLGTNYQGSINCGPSGCSGPAVNAINNAFGLLAIITLVAIIAVVVIVVVVVLVVRRRRHPPMGMMPPTGGPMMGAPPTGTGPMAPPPPPPPTYSPPSPPPPGAR